MATPAPASGGGLGFLGQCAVAAAGALAAGLGMYAAPSVAAGAGRARKAMSGGIVKELTTDLTEAARKGTIRPAFGRSAEVEYLSSVLSDRMLIFTGDPGVGKTAIVEKFACLVARGQIPLYKDYKILKLNLRKVGPADSLSALISDIVTGGGEAKVRELLDEISRRVQKGEKLILFIDEIQVLIRNYPTLFNPFLEQLARSELPIIGASMDTRTVRNWIDLTQGMARRVEEREIFELSDKETMELLQEGGASVLSSRVLNTARDIEVEIAGSAFKAAVQLSREISSWRAKFVNPDRPLKLLREATLAVLGQDLEGTARKVTITYCEILGYLRRHFGSQISPGLLERFEQDQERDAQTNFEYRRSQELCQNLLPFANGVAPVTSLEAIHEARDLLDRTFANVSGNSICYLSGSTQLACETVDQFFSGGRDQVVVLRASLRALCQAAKLHPGLDAFIEKALREKQEGETQGQKRHVVLHLTEADALVARLSEPISPALQTHPATPPPTPFPLDGLFSMVGHVAAHLPIAEIIPPVISHVRVPSTPPRPEAPNPMMDLFSKLVANNSLSMIVSVSDKMAEQCSGDAFRISIRPPSQFEVIEWLNEKARVFQPDKEGSDLDWIGKLVFAAAALDIHTHVGQTLADCCLTLFNRLKSVPKDDFNNGLATAIFQMTTSRIQPRQVQEVLHKAVPFLESRLLVHEMNSSVPTPPSFEIQQGLQQPVLRIEEASAAQINFRTKQLQSHCVQQSQNLFTLDEDTLLDPTLSQGVRQACLSHALEDATSFEEEWYLLVTDRALGQPWIVQALQQCLDGDRLLHLICLVKKAVVAQPQPSQPPAQEEGLAAQALNIVRGVVQEVIPQPSSVPAVLPPIPFPQARTVSAPWTEADHTAFIQFHLGQVSEEVATAFQRVYLAILQGRLPVPLSYDQIPRMLQRQHTQLPSQTAEQVYQCLAQFWNMPVNDIKFAVDRSLTPITYRFKRRVAEIAAAVFATFMVPLSWVNRWFGGAFATTVASIAAAAAWNRFLGLFRR
jgi:hypothetical protein